MNGIQDKAMEKQSTRHVPKRGRLLSGLLVMSALIFLLSSCTQNVYPPEYSSDYRGYGYYPSSYDVRFLVVDAYSRPMPGAWILIKTFPIGGGSPIWKKVRCDKRGYFHFPMRAGYKSVVYINPSRRLGAPIVYDVDNFYTNVVVYVTIPAEHEKKGRHTPHDIRRNIRIQKHDGHERLMSTEERVSFSVGYSEMGESYQHVEKLHRQGENKKATNAANAYIKKYSNKKGSRIKAMERLAEDARRGRKPKKQERKDEIKKRKDRTEHTPVSPPQASLHAAEKQPDPENNPGNNNENVRRDHDRVVEKIAKKLENEQSENNERRATYETERRSVVKERRVASLKSKKVEPTRKCRATISSGKLLSSPGAHKGSCAELSAVGVADKHGGSGGGLYKVGGKLVFIQGVRASDFSGTVKVLGTKKVSINKKKSRKVPYLEVVTYR